MPHIPADIWYEIMVQLQNCADMFATPIDLVRLSAVCKSSRGIFLSDAAWAKFNPYGLPSCISSDFRARLAKLSAKQRREMSAVWQLSGCRWKWQDYVSDYGLPYGVPDNLYHKLAVVAFVESNFDFEMEHDFHLMKCAVLLNPTNIRKTDPSIALYKELAILAVSHQASLFNDIPQALRDDEQVVLVALRNEPAESASLGSSILKRASPRLLQSADLKAKACKYNKEYARYFDVELTEYSALVAQLTLSR